MLSKLRSTIFACVVFVLVAISQSGCQLFILPFYLAAVTLSFVSQVLTLAIVLPIRLLPVAAKYAPLALLFVKKIEATNSFYAEAHSGPLGVFRTESFVDENGHDVSVWIVPADRIDEDLIEELEALPAKVILTDETHKALEKAELADVWNTLRGSGERLWVVGEGVERLRQAEETRLTV